MLDKCTYCEKIICIYNTCIVLYSAIEISC